MSSNTEPKLDVKIRRIIDKIADLILNCQSVLFTSGAGMSVNSGLGTFRGSTADIWPPLLHEPKMDYTEICNPNWFEKEQGNSPKHDTANFAYAFWTYQYQMFTTTPPHWGYAIAKQWSELDHIKFAYSFTSNIDGHWRKSGWNNAAIFECHGSIDYMQCAYNCCDSVWPTNDSLKLTVDSQTNCATDLLPSCPHCKRLARPNVLMFDDRRYAGERYNDQIDCYEQFKSDIIESKSTLLIIEIGAGTTVCSVRNESENVFNNKKWTAHLVRINPSIEHCQIDERLKNKPNRSTIELPLEALTALTLIDQALKSKIKR